MSDSYEDIINMPHQTSRKHPRMSMENRAAQFAPFAALTGFSDEVKETARLTDRRIELEDEFKLIISNKLNYLLENKDKRSEVIVTYFVYDGKKSGGMYVDKKGIIKKINLQEGIIIFEDKDIISINEIIDIEGEAFKN